MFKANEVGKCKCDQEDSKPDPVASLSNHYLSGMQ